MLKEYAADLDQLGKTNSNGIKIKKTDSIISKDLKKFDKSTTRQDLSKFTTQSVKKLDINEVLKKSVITPDFESLHAVPQYNDKKLREQRKVSNILFLFFHTNNISLL